MVHAQGVFQTNDMVSIGCPVERLKLSGAFDRISQEMPAYVRERTIIKVPATASSREDRDAPAGAGIAPRRRTSCVWTVWKACVRLALCLAVIVLMVLAVTPNVQAHTRASTGKHALKGKHVTPPVHVHKHAKRAKAALRHASGARLMHHKKHRHARTMKRKAKTVRPVAETLPDMHVLAQEPEAIPMDPWMRKALAESASPETQAEMPLADPWMPRDSSEATPADTPAEGLASKVLESAHRYLGTPYRFGGTTPEGFDCSGFVQHVFGENGIRLSRTSREQVRQGAHIPLSALRPGDLIFFGKKHRKHYRIHHVGLYIGNNRFIHAASSRSGQIRISELHPHKSRARVVMARRIIEPTPAD